MSKKRTRRDTERDPVQLVRRCERTVDRAMATPGPEAVRRALGGTLDSAEPTPERELILEQCIEALRRMPTRELIAALPVLIRYGSIDAQLRVVASKARDGE